MSGLELGPPRVPICVTAVERRHADGVPRAQDTTRSHAADAKGSRLLLTSDSGVGSTREEDGWRVLGRSLTQPNHYNARILTVEQEGQGLIVVGTQKWL